ncbi:MAG: transglycosylase family protein [Micrococcales bacterium]|nr:transglycosylase family protein [Micrococcales bacterium]
MSTTRVLPPESTDTPATPTAPTPLVRRWRRPGRRTLVVAAVLALVLTSAGFAVAAAHKTVTLDVDGDVRSVSTFARSLSGMLDDEGIVIGERDLVSGSFRDGATIVVRHAKQLPILTADGPATVWSTALTADEALNTLSRQHTQVALVAPRGADGQPELPLDLTAEGPAEVVVDGQTVDVAAGDVQVHQALAAAEVELAPQDEVTIVPAGDSVQVVVVRVVTEEITTTSEVPFSSTQTNDPQRTVGTRAVVTAGVPGVRTVVERVTTADGVERAREVLSDDVTTAPVGEVVAVGTKPKPKPATKPSSSPGSTPAKPGGSSANLNWAALAKCESGGNPTIVSKNGKYYGLYQFSLATWKSVGGTGLPSQASAAEQTMRAQMLYERSGAGQWPHCGPRLFT